MSTPWRRVTAPLTTVASLQQRPDGVWNVDTVRTGGRFRGPRRLRHFAREIERQHFHAFRPGDQLKRRLIGERSGL